VEGRSRQQHGRDRYGVFFNNVDLGDDVALPGSCRKTLSEREVSGRPWPLIADHELSTGGVIGSAHNAREDHAGVRLRAKFASTHKAQDLRTLVLEGHVDGMSITYEPLQHYPGRQDGRPVRFLTEIRIHEFTITPFPINPQARIMAAKAPNVAKPYGDVEYGDPGYLDEDGNQVSRSGKPGVARYPLTPDKVTAAWSYINQSHNAGQYTAEQLSAIKDRIRAAMRRHGHQVSESASLDLAAAGILAELTSDPDAMIGVGTLLADRKARADLAALEVWAQSQPRVYVDPTAPPALSSAEVKHREAVGRARFAPPGGCGACTACLWGAPCTRYG
jgi:HK97 family phage prohead protease